MKKLIKELKKLQKESEKIADKSLSGKKLSDKQCKEFARHNQISHLTTVLISALEEK